MACQLLTSRNIFEPGGKPQDSGHSRAAWAVENQAWPGKKIKLRHYTAHYNRRTMKKQRPDRFWEVDLGALWLLWWSDISTFVKTAVMFGALALPVLVPALIMWLMVANDISFETPP